MPSLLPDRQPVSLEQLSQQHQSEDQLGGGVSYELVHRGLSKTTRADHQMPDNSMAAMRVPSARQADLPCGFASLPNGNRPPMFERGVQASRP
jgi:hypothetical protein